MDYFDYSENFLEQAPDSSEQAPDSSEWDLEGFLDLSQEQERQKLEEELHRIGRQLNRREELHEETITELESKLDWYSDQLEQLHKQFSGKHGEREQLKNRINEFYTELRHEKRNRWRDRQELERERREITRELAEIEMDDLLSELL